jgi:hypothetical protein
MARLRTLPTMKKSALSRTKIRDAGSLYGGVSDERFEYALGRRCVLLDGYLSNAENLHHLFPEVVDDFHGDASALRLLEWAGGVAVEGGPSFGIDLGFEGGL